VERILRSSKILWRSERLLAEHQLKLATERVQLNAIAALVAVFGLLMLDVAAFFALAPLWGNALAALALAGGNLVLAAALAVRARSLQPGTEIAMVEQVRDMATTDLEEEAALVEAELTALKDEALRFVRNPVDALLPGLLGPLLGAAAKGLRSEKK
jgi:hypothetical protein